MTCLMFVLPWAANRQAGFVALFAVVCMFWWWRMPDVRDYRLLCLRQWSSLESCVYLAVEPHCTHPFTPGTGEGEGCGASWAQRPWHSHQGKSREQVGVGLFVLLLNLSGFLFLWVHFSKWVFPFWLTRIELKQWICFQGWGWNLDLWQGPPVMGRIPAPGMSA
jgi:hypothetical protein